VRTTLDLDDDILMAAKQLARQKGKTTGQMVSQLVRQALTPKNPPKVRNGVELLEKVPGAPIPTLDFVNRLRDE
jgi:hypothetical protein